MLLLLNKYPELTKNLLVKRFTPRELDMVFYLLQGDGNAEIAKKTNISEKAVKNNITRIYLKLEVVSRPKAIIKLMQIGLK